MIELEVEISDIKEYILDLSPATKREMAGSCPFCGKSGHFYINKTSLLWECKKCKEKGNSYRILKHFKVLDLYVKKNYGLVNKPLIKIGDGVGLEVKEEEEEEVELVEKKLPFSYKRIYSNEYLESRNFTKNDFYRNEIGLAKLSKKYGNYIIFPIFEEDKCYGFVGRCFLDKPEMEIKDLKRYENSRDSKFGLLLYGYNELSHKTKVVILVEGVFDKIRLDSVLNVDEDESIRVLCTFGNKVSGRQINKIKSKTRNSVNKVILFYDIDAVNEINKYSIELENNFNEVEICFLSDDKDASASSEEDIFKALSNTMKPDEFRYDKVAINRVK